MSGGSPVAFSACNRTFHNREGQYDEFMCGRHWAMAPKALKRRITKCRRRARRDPRWNKPANRLWQRCRDRINQDVLMGFHG